MRRCCIPGRSTPIAISILILTVCIAINAVAQSSDPAILSEPDFKLPDEAVAAGIEGAYRSSLSIDDAGNVRNIRLYGDPAWPCGTSPERELKVARAAVEDHLRLIKFSPATKNGRPREADVTLDFVVGDAFKSGKTAEEAKKSSPRIIKAGVVNGRAISLVKPLNTGAKGIFVVQVLIDEHGRVAKAGVFLGNRLHYKSFREAACESKFSPTRIEGNAVQVTGVINYIYR